jgi:RHS repeat-associated protein
VSETLAGTTEDFLFDGLGSVVGLADTSGTLQNTFRYDPYGNATSVTEAVSGNVFRYIGVVWDSSTGLYAMGDRYYDPTLGRFTQLDPLGGGYAYSYSDPINFLDPDGSMPYCVCRGGEPSFAPGKLEEHFDWHGKAMGYKTPDAYQEGARALLRRPIGRGGVYGFVRARGGDGGRQVGDLVVFDANTNEFAVLAPDGTTIKTYFVPSDDKEIAIEYYNDEVDAYAPFGTPIIPETFALEWPVGPDDPNP